MGAGCESSQAVSSLAGPGPGPRPGPGPGPRLVWNGRAGPGRAGPGGPGPGLAAGPGRAWGGPGLELGRGWPGPGRPSQGWPRPEAFLIGKTLHLGARGGGVGPAGRSGRPAGRFAHARRRNYRAAWVLSQWLSHRHLQAQGLRRQMKTNLLPQHSLYRSPFFLPSPVRLHPFCLCLSSSAVFLSLSYVPSQSASSSFFVSPSLSCSVFRSLHSPSPFFDSLS